MTNYVFIEQWMVDLFKPKEKKKGAGVDYVKLLIFAYIFSFSRDGVSKWYGKQQTLADLTGCSERVICTKLKELVNEGLIIKETVNIYGMIHHNNYWVNKVYIKDYSEETTIDSEEIAQCIQKKPSIDSEETNYKSNNKSLDYKSIDSIRGACASTPSLGNQKKNINNNYTRSAPASVEPMLERSDLVF